MLKQIQIKKGNNSHKKKIKKNYSNHKCNESIKAKRNKSEESSLSNKFEINKEDINMNDKDDYLQVYNNQIIKKDKELILKINEIIEKIAKTYSMMNALIMKQNEIL